uniref:Uncharacterized protein n=1 Tax=Siphoviridae sp. ctq1q8 TaxID=2826467 RepID=A0A8S5MFR3_9CAUD|nr:MAG TPA: hypothetical protein [Siphoviridae sp. ctq1q8]DAY55323.1 MAG TPA: hypothetical protein [Caudoviricetes sp.]
MLSTKSTYPILGPSVYPSQVILFILYYFI